VSGRLIFRERKGISENKKGRKRETERESVRGEKEE
jgi:hypothetical protein